MFNVGCQRVLVIAPHTDDGEFGCGGTISKLIDNNIEVNYVAFSYCEESVPDGFPKDSLINECLKATKTLGITPSRVSILNYSVRRFNERRQDILNDLIKLRKDINPDIVFVPSPKDIHQDHQTIANEAVRAFKFSNIFCHEVLWNNIDFNFNCFIHLEKAHIDKKVEALACYKTQQEIRSYMNEDFIFSLAKVRGIQAGTSYAEGFNALRLNIQNFL